MLADPATIDQLTSRAAQLVSRIESLQYRQARIVAARAALRVRAQYPNAATIRVAGATFLSQHAGLLVVEVAANNGGVLAAYDPVIDDLVAATVHDDLTTAVRLGGVTVLPGLAETGTLVLQALIDAVPTAGRSPLQHASSA